MINQDDPNADLLKTKGYTNIKNVLFSDYNEDSAINEMYHNDKLVGHTNSFLSFTNNYNNSKEFIREDLYAKTASHKDSNVFNNSFTNDGVKLYQEKEFLKNPREAIGKAIKSILDEVSKEYDITEDDKAMFSSFGDDAKKSRENRNNAIFQLQKKEDYANKKLIGGLETCNDLLTLLSQVETGSKNSFSQKTKEILDNKIDEAFKKEFIEDSFIPKEARQDIYRRVEAVDLDKIESLEDKKKEEAKIINHINEVLTPYYIENAERNNITYTDDIKSDIAGSLMRNVKDVSDLNSSINKYSSLTLELNTKVKMNKDFTSLYSLHTNYSKLSKDRNNESVDSTINDYKINKSLEELRQYVIANQDIVKNVLGNSRYADENRAEIEDFNNKLLNRDSFNELLKSDSIEEGKNKDKVVSNFISHYLTQSLHDNVDSILEENRDSFTASERQKIKTVTSSNIHEMAKEYSNAIGKEDGSFTARVSGEIYNNFQKKNFQNVVLDIVLDSDRKDSNNKKELKNDLGNFVANSKGSEFDFAKKNYDSEKIAEVMNFNNLNSNDKINKNISSEEAGKIARQTFKDSGLRDFAKDIRNTKISEDKNPKAKKDVPLQENLRNVSTSKYQNMSDSIVQSSLTRMLFSKKTFSEFKGCVSASSIQKTSMDTKLSGLDKCVTKLTTDMEQDAKNLVQLATQAVQGIGALNPLVSLFEIFAKIREKMVEGLKSDLERITEEVNKIALEAGSAHTELERRARINLLEAKEDGDVNFTAVHESERNVLASEIKQEFICDSIVENSIIEDFFKDKTKEQINEFIQESFTDLNISKMTTEQKQSIDNQDFADVLTDLDVENEELKDVQNYSEFLAKNPSKEDLEKLNISLDDALDLSKFNFENSVEKTETEEKSDMLIRSIEKIDLFQAKIAELKYANDGELKPLSEYRLFQDDNIEQELLSKWAIENDVTQDVFDDYISRDFEELDKEKLKLSFESIRTGLEIQKEDLIRKEEELIQLKEEAKELDAKFGTHNEVPEFKNESEQKEFDSYMLLKSEITNLEGILDSEIRPRERIENTIKEVENILKQDMSSIEKRNVLSHAVNVLSSNDSTFLNIEALEKYASLAVDFISDPNKEIDLLGIALDEKAYALKVNLETRTNSARYDSEKHREYLEKVDYESDLDLMNNTKESTFVTSLQSWTDVIKDVAESISSNNTVSDANRDIQARSETLSNSSGNSGMNTNRKVSTPNTGVTSSLVDDSNMRKQKLEGKEDIESKSLEEELMEEAKDMSRRM
ncbi:hypothetical protein [Poseidonibacter ostreae]|uniref:Uncharacterized protein n=1 Tax=Poseidonibacter ostreae TaxID=2654171 RepID=A0A6L4WWK8_9BACT|nr:hypothetical protein [Poseidonibacter ostreae]KAB7891271.1 hypothetical protein GBG19_00110 [Poseidonibacter ostreae]